MVEVIEWLQKNREWLFSGIGCLALSAIIGILFKRNDNSSLNICTRNGKQQINYGSGNNTQIINRNQYCTQNEMQGNPVSQKYDLLLIEYINSAINIIKEANEDLEYFGVNDSEKWYRCIQKVVVDNDWNYYLEKSSLSPDDIFILKRWFNSILKLKKCVTESQAINDMEKVKDWINYLLCNQDIYKIIKRLNNQQED